MIEHIAGSRAPAPIKKIPSQMIFKKQLIPTNNYFSRSQNKVISVSFKAIPRANTPYIAKPLGDKHEPHLRKAKVSSFRLRIWRKEEDEAKQQNDHQNIVKQQVKNEGMKQRNQKSQSCSKSVKNFIIRKTNSYRSYNRSNSAKERVISKDLKNNNRNNALGEVEKSSHNSPIAVNMNRPKDHLYLKQIGLIDSTVKLSLNGVKRKRKETNILDISTKKSIGYFDDQSKQINPNRTANKQNSYLQTEPNAAQLKKVYFFKSNKDFEAKSLKKSGKIRQRPHSACKTIKISWGNNQQKQESQKLEQFVKEPMENAFGLISMIQGESLADENNLSNTIKDICNLLSKQQRREQYRRKYEDAW